MAKPKKLPPPTAAADAAQQAVAGAEVPTIKWGVVAQIALVVVIVWGMAVGGIPWVGYWGVGVAGVATAALIGFGIYAWRLVSRQRQLLDVLKAASEGEEGRQRALEELAAKGTKDGMAALARANLLMRDDPKQAQDILASIDLEKEPGPVQDEVRANLSFILLLQGRPKDARPYVDQLRLDRQTNPKGKAMYAAVMAETLARTGDPAEAKKLLETYKPDDPDYGEASLVLLRAQVYTFHATKNRGLMRKALLELASRDPNQLGPFVQPKGVSPEIRTAALEALQGAGYQTKTKQKLVRQ